jgi:hypothetical protein
MSDFTRQDQQQQRQREKKKVRIPNHNNEDQQTQFLESPRKNGISNNHQDRKDDGNTPVNNGEKRGNFKQPQRNKRNTNFVNNDNAQQQQQPQPREKLQFKLENIAHTTHQAFGSDEARDAGHHHRPLWELSDFVPHWMKEYFEWHREKRQSLTENVWRKHHQWKNNNETTKISTNISSTSMDNGDGASDDPKFLVIQCLEQSQSKTSLRAGSKDESSCGSLSERLALLPYWLRMAHETNRLLFIHWTVPTDLLEYLEPPVGGCDWRAPMGLNQMVRFVFVRAWMRSNSSDLCGWLVVVIDRFAVRSRHRKPTNLSNNLP